MIYIVLFLYMIDSFMERTVFTLCIYYFILVFYHKTFIYHLPNVHVIYIYILENYINNKNKLYKLINKFLR